MAASGLCGRQQHRARQLAAGSWLPHVDSPGWAAPTLGGRAVLPQIATREQALLFDLLLLTADEPLAAEMDVCLSAVMQSQVLGKAGWPLSFYLTFRAVF